MLPISAVYSSSLFFVVFFFFLKEDEYVNINIKRWGLCWRVWEMNISEVNYVNMMKTWPNLILSIEQEVKVRWQWTWLTFTPHEWLTQLYIGNIFGYLEQDHAQKLTQYLQIQITEASSEWSQSVFPHGFLWHFPILVSVPLQSKSSIQIGPVPLP